MENPTGQVIQHFRRAALLNDGGGMTDGQLLGYFIDHRDEAAFAALLKRHGPMVWGVCRRLLPHPDAEDAFQAAFLVLVRKAASVLPREMVANWLYGVAHQAALHSRRTMLRRRTKERQVTQMPEPAVAEQDLWNDVQPLLDQELARLPDKYRVAIILCDLEGKTRKEVAQQLGCPEGTVAGRLARGRVMLAKRLARHGLAVSGGALAAVLSQEVASAGVPALVVSSTIKAAALLAAGETAAAGAISVKSAALAEGVLKSMLLTKLKAASAVLLVVAALSGTAGLIYQTQAAEQPKSPGRQSNRSYQSAELKNRVADLKKDWGPRDDKHAAALKFIYETWPGLVTPGVKARMKEAKDAFEVCKGVGDFIGPHKLLRGTERHAQRILKELSELKPDVNIDDEKPAKLIRELVPLLRQLDADLRAYLEKKRDKEKQPAARKDERPKADKGRVRILRWTIVFNTKDGAEYARQLEALGAKLAIPTKERNQYRMICDLSKRPVAATAEDISKVDRIFLLETAKEPIRMLTKELGLKETPEHIVVFLPRLVEDELRRKEFDFSHRPEKEIVETIFRFSRSKRGFDIQVTSQR